MKFSDIDFSAISRMMDSMSDEEKDRLNNMAQEMMDNVNKKCSQLYNVTKENIDRLLKSVEDYLLENLHVVRNNREELNGGLFKNQKKK